MDPESSPREERSTLVAMTLLAAYGLQAVIGVDWGALDELQQQESFRRWSGWVAAGFIGLQWAHPFVRGWVVGSRRIALNRVHQWLGSVTLVAFFVHSSRPGFGYLGVLTFTLLGSLAAGAAHAALPNEHRGSRTSLMFHVTASLLLIGLVLFHVWVVYAYTPGDGVRP